VPSPVATGVDGTMVVFVPVRTERNSVNVVVPAPAPLKLNDT
jgi:hypothetical protein